MATTMAEYFMDELTEWKRSISFYSDEIHELTGKLGEVIQRNSIPGIAAMVESEQDKLNDVSSSFHRLHTQFQKQAGILKTDSTFIDDSLVKPETVREQQHLRKYMHQAEKEYVNAKNDCRNFLSGVLKRKDS